MDMSKCAWLACRGSLSGSKLLYQLYLSGIGWWQAVQ